MLARMPLARAPRQATNSATNSATFKLALITYTDISSSEGLLALAATFPKVLLADASLADVPLADVLFAGGIVIFGIVVFGIVVCARAIILRCIICRKTFTFFDDVRF